MIKTSRFIYLSVLVPMLLVLSGCGDSDTGSTSAPAPTETAAAPTETAAAPAPEAEEDAPFDISTVEKADGVVYMDEIYENWPYN